MGSVALMSGLGAGLSTAGQGIDKQFQYKMEQQRLKSLQDLENRKLDIMEQGQKSENAYRQGTLKSAQGEAFDKAKADWQTRMDAIAEKITANLPDEATAAMTATLLKSVMKDSDLMLNYMDGETVDFEALGAAVSEAAQSMEIPGVLKGPAAQESITRFAAAMVKDWNRLRKRFPEYAGELNTWDVIDQIPAFYGTIPSEKEQTVLDLHEQGKQGRTPTSRGQASQASQASLMGEAQQAPPGVAQQIGDAGGLMSLKGLKEGYNQLSHAIYDPWINELETGKYANPDIPLLPMLSGEQVGKLKSGYRNAENAFSRFLFGDSLGGMTRGPDGMLHYPDDSQQNDVVIDPNVKDDYSFR